MGYRIGIISTRYSSYWGGNEELWFQTALEAKQQGHEVFVSVCDFRENAFRINQLRTAGIKVDLRSFKNDFKQKMQRKISQVAHRFKFDVLNPFDFIMKKSLDVVFIAQAGTFEVFNNIHLSEFLAKTNIPVVVNSQYLAEHTILPVKQFEKVRKLVPLVKLFAFVSNRNLQTFERMVSSKLENSLVVQNPVKARDFNFCEWPKNETLQMAVVGRLVCSDKGQDILLEILGNKHWSGRNWHLNIYGRGVDENYLKELVKLYGLEQKVSFRGFEKEVRNIWNNNHVLLLPSFAEGTPLVLIEAMCCGRAAVVTDVGGNAEFVQDAVTGIVAEAPTVNSFGKALEMVWSSQANLHKMGEDALRHAKKIIDLFPEKKLLAGMINALASTN